MHNICFNLKHVCILALILIKYCDCIRVSNLHRNISITDDDDDDENEGFSEAVATWYGDPNGAGSDGGACGYKFDVSRPPFSGMISAGNAFLFKSGFGCGACYEVKCTQNPACSGNPMRVTITDECACDNQNVHFDLSGKAFGAMAKPGQENALRNVGTFPVQFRKVPCKYPGQNLVFKIDPGSNPYYLALIVEYVWGDGDISSVQLRSTNSGDEKEWTTMQRSWGSVWKADLHQGMKGPFSIRITTGTSKMFIVAKYAIPEGWAPGQTYMASGIESMYEPKRDKEECE